MSVSKMAESGTQGRGRGMVTGGLSVPPGTASVTDPPSRDHSSDELNSKFRLQRLRSSSSTSSSSSSSSSSAYENPQSSLLLPSIEVPAATSLACVPRLPVAPCFSLPVGTSMTLPKVRTPLSPRDSIQLLKKHQSQPQPGLERFHHINVSIDLGCAGLPLLARSLSPGSTTVTAPQVEETDIDDGMEGVEEEAQAQNEVAQPCAGRSVSMGLVKECLDPDAVKPPTPPLHRFPAWVSGKEG